MERVPRGTYTMIYIRIYKQSPIMRGSASDGLFKNSPPLSLSAHIVCDWWSLVRSAYTKSRLNIYVCVLAMLFVLHIMRAAGRWGRRSLAYAPQHINFCFALAAPFITRKRKKGKATTCVRFIRYDKYCKKGWPSAHLGLAEPAGNANKHNKRLF